MIDLEVILESVCFDFIIFKLYFGLILKVFNIELSIFLCCVVIIIIGLSIFFCFKVLIKGVIFMVLGFVLNMVIIFFIKLFIFDFFI